MKPYQTIPIQDCQEALVSIPLEEFAVEAPHPYEKLGAPYGERSPYFLRESVLKALQQAQQALQEAYSGWRILIFDAYRPVEVQQFMVDYTFAEVLKNEGLNKEDLTPTLIQQLLDKVYVFWAVPSLDSATPPPHSTGAAVDVSLVDAQGIPVDMGGEIDELSERSHPNYYANSLKASEQRYHHNRQILAQAMKKAGFSGHPQEWWHFSLGDQMWAWQGQQNSISEKVARYGRI